MIETGTSAADFCEELGRKLAISAMLGEDNTSELTVTLSHDYAAEMSRRLRQAPRVIVAEGRLPLLYCWPRLWALIYRKQGREAPKVRS